MLTELTARALERSKAFARVVAPGYSADADWVLDGFVSSLLAFMDEPEAAFDVVSVVLFVVSAVLWLVAPE